MQRLTGGKGSPLAPASAGAIHVAPGPHVHSSAQTTWRMMADVLLALVPVIVTASVFFGPRVWLHLGVCSASAFSAEALFAAMRRKAFAIRDASPLVTGWILALSLPVTAPWYVGLLGSAVAIGLGRAVFGGLGQNIFNPAMVGRAFVMVAFPALLGAAAYVDERSAFDAVTRATPLTVWKQEGAVPPLRELLLGNTNGSPGETSALMCLVGGLYLCLRRTASWEIPAGALLAAGVLSGAIRALSPLAQWTVLHELASGSLIFGAFFVATDPVSSPLTPRGKWLFGAGVGALVILIRRLSGYPEGLMFAVLLMNAATPLINRWTVPVPLGGPVPNRNRT